jgi:uncharacterized delta-60 repeat protein
MFQAMTLCRPRMRVVFGLSLGMLASSFAIADGTLDPNFGSAGQVMVPRLQALATANTSVGEIALLSNGGVAWVLENGAGATTVGRVRADGALDLSFGQAGQLQTSCGRPGPTRLIALPNNVLVVWTGSCLRKLDASGAEDVNFAASAQMPPTASAQQFRAAALMQDAQGRFLLAGRNGLFWQVYRFLADGRNDATFGSSGIASVPIVSQKANDELHAMHVLADGSVVLVGGRLVGVKTHVFVYKLNALGLPALDFGVDAAVEIAPPSNFQGNIGEAITATQDGSLLITGRAYDGGNSCCVLVAKLAANGAFSASNVKLLTLGDEVSLDPFGETRTAIAKLPSGKIVIALTTVPSFVVNTRSRFTLMRLREDLSLDSSFDRDGWRSYVAQDPEAMGQSGAYTQLHSAAIADGKVLLFGRTFFEEGVVNFSYSTLMRARLDGLFNDGFESQP